jgi:hypothetical protein
MYSFMNVDFSSWGGVIADHPAGTKTTVFAAAKVGKPGPTTSPTSYVSGDPLIDDAQEYNITINFKGSWTTELLAALVSHNAVREITARVRDQAPQSVLDRRTRR